MAALRPRLRSGLRRFARRAAAQRPVPAADVSSVIRTFSSIEFVGSLAQDHDYSALEASLESAATGSIKGIEVVVANGTFRLGLPISHIAQLSGDNTFAIWLHAGPRCWQLTRLPAAGRGPIGVPTSVLRCGADSVRVRITSNREGRLMVHTTSLSVAA